MEEEDKDTEHPQDTTDIRIVETITGRIGEVEAEITIETIIRGMGRAEEKEEDGATGKINGDQRRMETG